MDVRIDFDDLRLHMGQREGIREINAYLFFPTGLRDHIRG